MPLCCLLGFLYVYAIVAVYVFCISRAGRYVVVATAAVVSVSLR